MIPSCNPGMGGADSGGWERGRYQELLDWPSYLNQQTPDSVLSSASGKKRCGEPLRKTLDVYLWCCQLVLCSIILTQKPKDKRYSSIVECLPSMCVAVGPRCQNK